MMSLVVKKNFFWQPSSFSCVGGGYCEIVEEMGYCEVMCYFLMLKLMCGGGVVEQIQTNGLFVAGCGC